MDDKNYILFESYLSGELSTDEIKAFELRLKNESELKQALNTYKELSSFLEHKFENEEESKAFESNLKKISNQYFDKEDTASTKTTTSKVFKLYKYAIAACVAVLLGLFTFNELSSPSFNDYNDYETISLVVRGEQEELLKTAEDAFNKRNFTEANRTFGELINGDSQNMEYKLYQGITLVELNQFTKADNLLKVVAESPSVYKNKAIWYLGLSKLKQENYNECIDVLKLLPEDADDYDKAQKLIKKLD
ncbi:tetratricopeptide repeat protein [Seonamhaeicola marinus]|uniref:Tetratricopeptide repeat protein n=1 Tax=Seonamhaeicola marinus TaxID=1912246 RepID=A0A5D0HVG5_9FLAO|nr:hypothetical protein [Seonamhaeicola marinus]TYA74499.1 hypothetical protein FUA24_14340 [Seonamhaeicola marinus]